MPNIDLVVLDLDGTLYSSTATTLGAVERAVRDLNERHGNIVSLPAGDRVMSGVGSTRHEFARKIFPTLPDEHVEEMDDLIWHWERTLVDEGMGSLFPGAVEALEALSGLGCRLAVATNAGSGYMNHILDYFDIRRYFDDARCAGDEGTSDKGVLLTRILERLSVDASRAVMVGDRLSDVEGARRAGVLVVGCTWGFASSDELARADALVESFAELTELIGSWS